MIPSSTFFLKNISYLIKRRKFSGDLFKKLSTEKTEPTIAELMYISETLAISIDELLKSDLQKTEEQRKKHNIKFLVLDVDGVMTDAGMYFTESGDEFKKFNAKDGIAIKKLAKSGIKVGFLSSGINNNIIHKRAEMLGAVYVYAGTEKKSKILDEWKKELKISYQNIAYIGDDINDLEVIQKVGLTACPADAVNKIKDAVDTVLVTKGGDGCVREFIEKYFMEI